MNQDIFNIFKVFNSFSFPILCCRVQLKHHSPSVLWTPSSGLLKLVSALLSCFGSFSLSQLDWSHQHIKLPVLICPLKKTLDLTSPFSYYLPGSLFSFTTKLESAVSPFTSYPVLSHCNWAFISPRLRKCLYQSPQGPLSCQIEYIVLSPHPVKPFGQHLNQLTPSFLKHPFLRFCNSTFNLLFS